MDLVENMGGVGKLFGFGGGDCGIVFLKMKELVEKFVNEWEKFGIKYLFFYIGRV